MPYVYILKSLMNNSYYIGSCNNVDVRFTLHNKGAVPSTKRYCPWQLVYTEEHPNLVVARRRELQIKSWKKRAVIEKLLGHFKI
jgi:putative endonuclease